MSKFKCVMQHDMTDCAAACLAMICLYYNKDMTITRLRDICGTDIKGTTVKGLMDGADKLDLESKAVRVTQKEFSKHSFTLPSICHLLTNEGLSHFVVVTKIHKNKVTFLDPAKGKTSETLVEFFKKFDGVMVLLKPTNLFMSTKNETKSIFWKFVSLLKPQKRLFVSAIVASLILTLLGIASSFFNKILMDEILPYNLRNQLTIFCIGFLVLGIVQVGLGAVRQHILLHLSQKVDIPLMLGYYKHVMHLPMKFFGTRKTGDILTRFQDAGTIKQVLSSIILSVIIDVVMAVISGVVLFLMNKTLFIVIAILTLISIVLVYIFKHPYKKINLIQMEQGAKLNSQLIESLKGIETVKANAVEDHSLELLENRFIDCLKTSYKENVLSNIQGSISSIISTIGNLVLMWIGATLVMNGEITLGSLMAFSSLAGFFMDPIGRLVSIQLSVQEASIAMKRLSEIYDVEEEQQNKENLLKGVSFNGDIVIKNVTFRYGSRQPVLNKIDLKIKAGEKVAIVGESGSGKTTLSKLLLGLWKQEDGEISINGYNIDEVDLQQLRERTAYVSQNVELFSGSITDNLKIVKPNATYDDIKNACEQAGCSEFINRMPAKYESFLEEAGANLSGGERQRLSLARALIKKPEILILDEATSNLDFSSEAKVYETLFHTGLDCTMVVIAHRLSTIRRCDKIFVLDNGVVSESGTHNELINSDGLYKKLWDSQVGNDVDCKKPKGIIKKEEIKEIGGDEIEYN